MGSIEQRRHPRINVDFFADWGWSPECEYYDKITSLSLGGCFLATRREVRAGDQIYLRMRAETVTGISLRGSIRYQQRLMEGAPPNGAGVEFLELSPAAQATLQQLMDFYRQPI